MASASVCGELRDQGGGAWGLSVCGELRDQGGGT